MAQIQSAVTHDTHTMSVSLQDHTSSKDVLVFPLVLPSPTVPGKKKKHEGPSLEPVLGLSGLGYCRNMADSMKEYSLPLDLKGSL